MKKILICLSVLFSIELIQAQTNPDFIEKGTVLTIGNVNASSFQHIYFPRKNIIIKRGGIPNFYHLEGKKVVVDYVLSKKESTIVVLKRADGRNFFGYYPSVKADLKKAIEKGELKISR